MPPPRVFIGDLNYFLRLRSPITNFGDDNLLDPEQKPPQDDIFIWSIPPYYIKKKTSQAFFGPMISQPFSTRKQQTDKMLARAQRHRKDKPV